MPVHLHELNKIWGLERNTGKKVEILVASNGFKTWAGAGRRALDVFAGALL